MPIPLTALLVLSVSCAQRWAWLKASFSMEVVLIACAKGKAKGGLPWNGGERDRLFEGTSELTMALMSARHDLAVQLRCYPGEDLGFAATPASLRFLPAYKRYRGELYRASQLADSYPTPGIRVLIISALYGLLDASEAIRCYELPIQGIPPFSVRPQVWWPSQDLGGMVEERILSLGPTAVHDLLSKSYRAVLRPWPRPSFAGLDPPRGSPQQPLGPTYQPFDPPPGAPNSNTLRGRKLLEILQASKLK